MATEEGEFLIPPRSFLRICRRNARRLKVADSSGVELTGGGLLWRTLILRRILRREVLKPDEKRVGVLLPPSAGGVLANAALSIDGRVAVNLNYTLSSEIMNRCIARAGVRHVLTARRVLERFPLSIDAEVVLLDQIKDRARLSDKLLTLPPAWLFPLAVLERRLGLSRADPDDPLTIIFTSGSTGDPKGVVLTHRNVGSNVASFNKLLRLGREDVLLGILPFFHSFGYTTGLWTVLLLDPQGAYHYTPLEPGPVSALARRYGATILVATPTFLRSYVRRCPPEDFAKLEVVITGAEKLPSEVAGAFHRQFGVRPWEGYGTTELSPVVSCNVPPSRALGGSEGGCREGTVGRPIDGVSAKIVDLDTGEDLGLDRPGMLLVKGHNVMKGYLDRPDLTAQVIRDGWYVTGDVAMIDADGFIRITGRVSRFSKLGGEMVPHLAIEEALHKLLATHEDELRLVVTGVPNIKKGERIVVLHTGLDRSPEEVCRDLAALGLPPLWTPSPDSFVQVPAIPTLGTGKLDLRAINELALAKFPDEE
jgi:acyl-[acyl-carrier-protein]-phospholipid O-acyltransferase/long-chain-fatty-acid--[acyl-carrier-protein] ligase